MNTSQITKDQENPINDAPEVQEPLPEPPVNVSLLAAPRKSESEGRRLVTLENYGRQLPIGMQGNKALEFREWNGLIEEDLAAAMDKKRKDIKKKPLLYPTTILATMLARVGPHVFFTHDGDNWKEEMPLDRRIHHVSQMWYGDVQYAYVYMVYEQIDSVVKLKLRAGSGEDDETIPWQGDLGDFWTTAVDDFNQSLKMVEFSGDAIIRNTPVRRVVVGPARWSAYLDITQKRASRKALDLLPRSIIQVPDTSIQNVSIQDLRRLNKKAINKLAAAIDANHVGLELNVSYEDPDTGEEVSHHIDWLSPDFLKPSSQ